MEKLIKINENEVVSINQYFEMNEQYDGYNTVYMGRTSESSIISYGVSKETMKALKKSHKEKVLNWLKNPIYTDYGGCPTIKTMIESPKYRFGFSIVTHIIRYKREDYNDQEFFDQMVAGAKVA